MGLLRLNLAVFGVRATHVMVSHQKLSVSALKYWIFFFFFPFFPICHFELFPFEVGGCQEAPKLPGQRNI